MAATDVGVQFVVDTSNLQRELLKAALAAGVPLRIAEYQRDQRDALWLLERARWAGDMVAHHGDALMYRTKRSKHSPSTADVCNALIEGVAAAALLAQGGITFLDLHFDAQLQESP
jgi:hypothetical protein